MTDATVQTIEPKTLESIRTVANIGSGTMGHATALQFAVAGYPVKLVDCSEELLKRGMEHIRADAEEFAQAGLLRAEDTVDDVLSRISTYTDYENGVSDADFIIESIVEKLDVKQSVWQQIEQYAPVDAIFATNTSGLGPTAIQSVLKHPERFVVAHFWNPAHLMPLVEVVPGKDTAPEVVDTTFDLMASIGKKPAKIKKESLGFVGNRMQLALLREAFNIINEGIADAETVDTVVRYSLGRRWNLVGPVTSADLGGLDTFYNISTYLFKDMDNGTEPSPLLAWKVQDGNLGTKTGRGFYEWQGEDGQRIIRERDEQLMQQLAEDAAVEDADCKSE